MTEDDRTFVRELLLRFGKHQDAVLTELREQRKTWQAEHRQFLEEMQEMRAETRAQIEAIWRVIDRMDRLDGGPATA